MNTFLAKGLTAMALASSLPASALDFASPLAGYSKQTLGELDATVNAGFIRNSTLTKVQRGKSTDRDIVVSSSANSGGLNVASPVFGDNFRGTVNIVVEQGSLNDVTVVGSGKKK